jgi:hypothetical protein
VAGFIGVSNLLPGEDGAQISVRPEKIWLGDLEHGMTSMEGTVVERVYVGTTTQVIVELDSGVAWWRSSRTPPGRGPTTAGRSATG